MKAVTVGATLERKIGIEAEVLLKSKGEFVNAEALYLPHDGYPLLAEIRGEPGSSVNSALANFYRAKLRLDSRLKGKKPVVRVHPKAFGEVPIEVHLKAQQYITNKDPRSAPNIHGNNSNFKSNNILNDAGEIEGVVVSCGLHLHFSCLLVAGVIVQTRKKSSSHKNKTSVISETSMKATVEELDKTLLTKYNEKYGTASLKYRMPGFYKIKSYGFEYRSLPYSPKMFGKELESIVDEAWKIFYRHTYLV